MEQLAGLVGRATQGDLEAFAKIVRRFQDMAYGCAYSILGDFHLAEDAAQNSFFQAYRELEKLRKPGAFPGWFHKIVLTNCRRLTRGRRLPTVSLEAAGGRASCEPGPGELAEVRESRKKVHDAIRSLPENERMVITLFYIRAYSQDEIAAFLDVPKTTVNNRLHTARRRLKERMVRMVARELKDNALPRDFGEDFNPAVEQALKLCLDKFSESLKAIFIGGSIAFGEALPGVSNFNWWMFLDAEPDEADLAWCKERERTLDEQYPAINGFSLCLFSLDRLRKETFWRFIFRYNTVQLYGRDVLAQLEKEGYPTPIPSRELAQGRIWFVEECIDSAVRGKLTDKLFKLPEDPHLAARKLARNFVLVEGAYLLMADDAFVSFQQKDILERLNSGYPQWRDLFSLAERINADPAGAGVSPDDFVSQVEPFVRWAIERTKTASSEAGQ